MTASERQSFLGGSDIAGILGISRWKTPLSVWAEKTGQFIPTEEDNEAKELGTELEDYVGRRFERKTGKKVVRTDSRFVHHDHPFLSCQVDRLVTGEDALLECKTTSAWKAKEWDGEEIPAEYICQVMYQLAITGRKVGYIACLIGNQKFVWKEIKRDPVMIAEMIKRAVRFWEDFIIPQVMPSQITAMDSETLLGLYPMAEVGTEIVLGDEVAKIVESRNAFYQDVIQVEREIERLDNELKSRIKANEVGIAGKWQISWKNVKRKACIVKESEYRKFVVKEIKNG